MTCKCKDFAGGIIYSIILSPLELFQNKDKITRKKLIDWHLEIAKQSLYKKLKII